MAKYDQVEELQVRLNEAMRRKQFCCTHKLGGVSTTLPLKEYNAQNGVNIQQPPFITKENEYATIVCTQCGTIMTALEYKQFYIDKIIFELQDMLNQAKLFTDMKPEDLNAVASMFDMVTTIGYFLNGYYRETINALTPNENNNNNKDARSRITRKGSYGLTNL